MRWSNRVSGALLLSCLFSCKTLPPQQTSRLHDSSASAVSESCQVDPQVIAKQLYSPPSDVESAATPAVNDQDSANLNAMCQAPAGSQPIGFSDPSCRDYCQTCTLGLEGNAQNVYLYLSTPLNAMSAFGWIGQKYKVLAPLAPLATKVANIYSSWNSALNLDSTLAATGCASALFDLGSILYTYDNTSSSAVELLGKIICDVNYASNSCLDIPVVGRLVQTLDLEMLSNPATAMLKTGLSITCPVGRYVATNLIKCPAFKTACKGALANAQPIDDNTCCVCGNLLAGDKKTLAQPWGGSIYAGSSTCEDLDDSQIRNRFPGIPSGGKLGCVRVKADPSQAHGCSLQRVVYGSNISCNKDQNVYCVDTPLLTSDSTRLEAPAKPLLPGCTKYLSADDLSHLIDGYADSLKTVSVPISAPAKATGSNGSLTTPADDAPQPANPSGSESN